MRTPRTLLVVTFLAAAFGNGALASGKPAGAAPAVAQGPASLGSGQSEQANEAQAAEGEQEEGAPEIEQEPSSIDPATLPAIDIGTTDEQETALRLVESILEEQRLLLSGQNFVYQADGRRDPFRSLLAARRRELSAPELRPAGLRGFLINEIAISATASYQGRWQAMIVGIDERAYFMHVGDFLYDGRVTEISGDEVIFEQEVEDLLGARSTRRVSKRLLTGNQEY